MSSRIVVSLRVDATPQRAFDVFTREIGLWWQPNGLFRFTSRSPGRLALEPKPGGRFTETLSNGEVFEIGRVIAWAPPHRLRLTWRQATFGPEQATEVEVRFEPVGAQTRVIVEHSAWDTVPPEHVARHGFPEAIFLRRHGQWWHDLLRALADRAGHPGP